MKDEKEKPIGDQQEGSNIFNKSIDGVFSKSINSNNTTTKTNKSTVGLTTVSTKSTMGVSTIYNRSTVGLSGKTTVGMSTISQNSIVGVSTISHESTMGVDAITPKTDMSNKEPVYACKDIRYK